MAFNYLLSHTLAPEVKVCLSVVVSHWDNRFLLSVGRSVGPQNFGAGLMGYDIQDNGLGLWMTMYILFRDDEKR
jgi:hypothetical protein